jgi:hypothetical protein
MCPRHEFVPSTRLSEASPHDRPRSHRVTATVVSRYLPVFHAGCPKAHSSPQKIEFPIVFRPVRLRCPPENGSLLLPISPPASRCPGTAGGSPQGSPGRRSRWNCRLTDRTRQRATMVPLDLHVAAPHEHQSYRKAAEELCRLAGWKLFRPPIAHAHRVSAKTRLTLPRKEVTLKSHSFVFSARGVVCDS